MKHMAITLSAKAAGFTLEQIAAAFKKRGWTVKTKATPSRGMYDFNTVGVFTKISPTNAKIIIEVDERKSDRVLFWNAEYQEYFDDEHSKGYGGGDSIGGKGAGYGFDPQEGDPATQVLKLCRYWCNKDKPMLRKTGENGVLNEASGCYDCVPFQFQNSSLQQETGEGWRSQ